MIRLDADWDAVAAEPHEDLDDGPGPEQAAYLIYTSGIDRDCPKGWSSRWWGLINHALAAIELYGPAPEDRVLQFASPSFDISMEELPAVLVCRLPRCAPARRHHSPGLAKFSRWLERERISVVDLPTAFWQEWAYELRACQEPPPFTLRLVIVGGEKATARRWRCLAGGGRWSESAGSRPMARPRHP